MKQFKYLGHIIDHSCSDDSDINREVKNLFMRTNILCRRFKRCSLHVKVRLFRTFCLCMYDTALWANFSAGAMNMFASCYNKCMKSFFGYPKYSSVTSMLFDVGLPSFNTLIHNSSVNFQNKLVGCDNGLVRLMVQYFHL